MFPIRPTAIKPFLREETYMCVIRVLTVASVQRLKMEALIPAPADCEVRCMIEF